MHHDRIYLNRQLSRTAYPVRGPIHGGQPVASIDIVPDALGRGAVAHITCRSPLGAADGRTAAPFQVTTREKRSTPRRRVLLSAIVVNDEFDGVVRCQLRDVSETGARLVIPASLLVPAGFWLIAVSAGLAYRAALVWRKYPNAGVALEEPIELDDPATRIAKRLRAIWVTATT